MLDIKNSNELFELYFNNKKENNNTFDEIFESYFNNCSIDEKIENLEELNNTMSIIKNTKMNYIKENNIYKDNQNNNNNLFSNLMLLFLGICFGGFILYLFKIFNHKENKIKIKKKVK